LTPSGGIVGRATNSTPAAGHIGEKKESEVLVASAVPLTSSVVGNVTYIDLDPGQWMVYPNVLFTYGATTSITHLQAGGSTSSAALNNTERSSHSFPGGVVPGTLIPMGWACPEVEVKVPAASTTRVYLVAYGVFTVSTLSAYGKIKAIRIS
jgi:hypothetical protein